MNGLGLAFKVLRRKKLQQRKSSLEISQKLETLRAGYEEQKKITVELQLQSDSIRRVQRERQEESFQINKGVEIREIQVSSLKQELEKHATDTTHQSASLAEFENKLKILQEELTEKKCAAGKFEIGRRESSGAYRGR